MTTYNVLQRLRKGPVLTPAQFGCLAGLPTLNVTQGCMFQCAYCYARGYSQAPPKGDVHLYTNLPGLLEKELARKRIIPRWVVLNTASDCFQPDPDILAVTMDVIRTLLDHQIGISMLTKGWIPAECLRLFGRAPEKIQVQIGLVSFSDVYRRTFEPFAPAPARREENIRRLKGMGIQPEVRMDPIIPFLTDTEAELEPFF